MKYYYRFRELPEKASDEYYTESEINAIPLYPETPELQREFENDESSDLWPVHDVCGFSWEGVECKSEDEAREHLGVSLNQSVYEYIHDI